MASRLSLELARADADATVTAFVERVVGEPVDAHERTHAMTRAARLNLLAVEGGRPLLERSAVLRGRRSAQPYVYAESLLAPSRLPAGFCGRLETSRDPIGRLLEREGIGFTRSPLSLPEHPRATVEGFRLPEDHLFARRYLLLVDGLAAMVVAEWFLPALGPFFDDHP